MTGHKSLKALRTYERTSKEQKRAAGQALSGLTVFKCEDMEQKTSTGYPESNETPDAETPQVAVVDTKDDSKVPYAAATNIWNIV